MNNFLGTDLLSALGVKDKNISSAVITILPNKPVSISLEILATAKDADLNHLAHIVKNYEITEI
ncbi:hypothetical protein [Methylobacter sp. S3L5C]|uniref:hypothetical protein n=1 Tax=Methylobacter sp. S3L5C TaxID=2839024 RepID=UPI001FADDA68|nr:hypothetical protein [Methylobacter sp. S3L5C]UOA08329.1 hypothetical protein KKZ03_19335 [Methylobacter sp. S3L5C]